MHRGSAESYYCFTRTWWKKSAGWPNGLEPCPGERRTVAKGMTRDEALEFCKEWNASHDPGRLSRKCEFDSE